MGRTPSAWLCPDSNRITLRVSSSTDPDVGSDTVASLQSRAWNHVAFSFQNNTKEAFSATVFVNGEVDISVEFRDIDVVGNNGPLHIGRDPTNPGPRRVGKNRVGVVIVHGTSSVRYASLQAPVVQHNFLL